MSNPELLQRILDQVTEQTTKGDRPSVVFDIDSTLFDITDRNVQILRQAATEDCIKTRFPDQCQTLSQVQIRQRDWGVRVHMERLGLLDNEDFYHCVRDYWFERFFSNDFLDCDQPYEGAVEYVLALHDAGAHIVYLTGRDEERMGVGTRKSMQQFGFPVEMNRAELALKPKKEMKDSLFKLEYFETFVQQYRPIWFFENEPVNIHLIRDNYPQIEVIYFDSVHSGRAPEPEDLPKLSSYDRYHK